MPFETVDSRLGQRGANDWQEQAITRTDSVFGVGLRDADGVHCVVEESLNMRLGPSDLSPLC